MRKAGKFGPEAASNEQKDAPEGLLEAAEASENALQAPAGGAAPLPFPCRPAASATG